MEKNNPWPSSWCSNTWQELSGNFLHRADVSIVSFHSFIKPFQKACFTRALLNRGKISWFCFLNDINLKDQKTFWLGQAKDIRSKIRVWSKPWRHKNMKGVSRTGTDTLKLKWKLWIKRGWNSGNEFSPITSVFHDQSLYYLSRCCGFEGNEFYFLLFEPLKF